MRYYIPLVLALGFVASGCSESGCAAACGEGGLVVLLEPALDATYDVELDLDGVSGAFTCDFSEATGWAPTERTGSGQAASSCEGRSFTVADTPAAVGISVETRDGFWSGSLSADAEYAQAGPECAWPCPLGGTLTVALEGPPSCEPPEEGAFLCQNGEIDPIVPCCEPPAPPTQPDACAGDESVENPSSCTRLGNAVTYLLTQLEVFGDCNVGYDLDDCFGQSCLPGGLTAAEGLDGVDNGIAGLAPISAGVGGNFATINQGFADAICGKTRASRLEETCELDVPQLELRIVVNENLDEGCANVTASSGPDELGSVAMNLSDDGCLSGQLPDLPLESYGAVALLSNVTLRATIGETGFSHGVMGATGDEVFEVLLSEALFSLKSSVIKQLFDINGDLSGNAEKACNAVSGTYRIGGVVER